MKINILLCDDEETSLQLNEEYIRTLNKQFQVETNILAFTSVTEKLEECVRKGDIHIAFLDIDLKDTNGIVLAKQILAFNPQASIVFITGHGQFTSQAYQVEAVGYIEKPVKLEQLERIYKRVLYMVQGLEQEKGKRTITMKSGAKLINIKCSDIIYVEKVLKKVVIHTIYGSHEFYEAIGAVEELLGESFLRVNQGTIVNIEEILYIDKNSLFMKSGEIIRIGRTYSRQVKMMYADITNSYVSRTKGR